MPQYLDLRDGLVAFRAVFEQRLLPNSAITHEARFLSSLAKKSCSSWTSEEAARLYFILKDYKGWINKTGFDFDTINPIKPPKTNSKRIGYSGGSFVVKFPYDKQLVAEIRKIKGRKYDGDKRCWTIPSTQAEDVRAFASINGFKMGEAARSLLTDGGDNLKQSYSSKRVELDLPLKHELYDFQTVGVDYARRNKRVVIGDQMGLGKTIQAIGGIIATNSFPVLVVCPKPLRLNWRDEWQGWTSKKTMVLTHKNIGYLEQVIKRGLAEVVITNYEGLLTFFVDEIREVLITKGPKAGTSYQRAILNGREKLFKAGIIDEAHKVRNHRTIRFKAAKKAFLHMKVRILLTGTPIVKGPGDLAALLDICGTIDDFGGAYKFKKMFRGIGKDFANSGAKGDRHKLRKLNVMLRSKCFIRREKHQVLTELPDKFRKVISIEISNRKEYDHAYFSLQSWMASKGVTSDKIGAALRAEILVQMGVLKQLSAKGKLDAVKDFVQNVLNGGEKIVIFCWHNKVVDFFAKQFPGSAQISGEKNGRPMKDEEIQADLTRFQTDPETKVIICTYKKGGVGFTLTAASKVAFVELGWTYADQAQAEDRCHRIGQKDSVECYYFLGADTIDQDIYKIIESRRLIEKEGTGGTEKIPVTFGSLINKIRADKKQPNPI